MKLFLILAIFLNFAFAREVPFTLEDRERIIRLEEGQKAIIQRIEDTNRRIEDTNRRIEDTNKRIEDTNKRIEDTNKRIDDVISIMLWGFGVLFAGMMTLIGFVIWDRRSALAPAIRKAKELEEREDKMERVLRELARKIPEVKEAMQKEGLL